MGRARRSRAARFSTSGFDLVKGLGGRFRDEVKRAFSSRSLTLRETSEEWESKLIFLDSLGWKADSVSQPIEGA